MSIASTYTHEMLIIILFIIIHIYIHHFVRIPGALTKYNAHCFVFFFYLNDNEMYAGVIG